MQKTKEILSEIEIKVNKLVEELNKFKLANVALSHENNRLSEELNQLKKMQVNATKAVMSTMDEEEWDQYLVSSKKMKKDLEQYIRQIEDCIESINKS
ncbi:MAG: hypothetical protein KA010_02610 [Saprospiraceae bacterium]|nr:hypothetical protein [Saprospiraceae bacterium]